MARHGPTSAWALAIVVLVALTCDAQRESEDYDSGDDSRRANPFAGNRVRLMRDPNPEVRRVNYQCWEPADGLSNPIVTLVTIMLSHNQAQQFVNSNRLSYILHQGYRYCELNEAADSARIAAWSKLPLMLSLLPCSDYVIHVDGDAILANHSLSFGPWLAHMQAKNIDLLLSSDCIRESPINFGMFIMRPAPWLLKLFKTLYNRCACDWSRLHDWPAEQGLLYDQLVEWMKEPWHSRVQIAKWNGWNRFQYDGFNGTNMLRGEDLVVHMTGLPKFKADGHCGANATCKFEEIMKWHSHAIETKQIPAPKKISQDLFLTGGKCLPILFKSLVPADVTYHNRPHERNPSSFLDFQVNRRGYVTKILIGEIACLGYRQSRCDLKQYWDTKTGKGPWMPELLDPLQTAPLDHHWHGRQQRMPKRMLLRT